MRRPAAVALFVSLLLATSWAAALDFVAVGERSAILYEADSLKSKKLFVVSRYMPLEQVIVRGEWVKVRDSGGSMAWIEKRALSSKRYVMVTAASASVHQAPEQNSPVAFTAAQNVALEWLGSAGGGWSRVRHPDGSTGFLRSSSVWGDE